MIGTCSLADQMHCTLSQHMIVAIDLVKDHTGPQGLGTVSQAGAQTGTMSQGQQVSMAHGVTMIRDPLTHRKVPESTHSILIAVQMDSMQQDRALEPRLSGVKQQHVCMRIPGGAEV